MLIGAHHVHFHLARGIAAQPRAILHQDHARSVTRRRNRRAHARQSTPGHQDIGLQPDLAHVRFRGRKPGVPGSDLIEIRRRRRSALRGSLPGQHHQRIRAEPKLTEEIATVHRAPPQPL